MKATSPLNARRVWSLSNFPLGKQDSFSSIQNKICTFVNIEISRSIWACFDTQAQVIAERYMLSNLHFLILQLEIVFNG